MSDQVQPVTSTNLPAPVGPYSPAMIFGNLIFVSGQAGRDPATGGLGPDVMAQTQQVLKNIATLLPAARSSLQHLIRCRGLLLDIEEFPEITEVHPPAVRLPPRPRTPASAP